MKEIEHKFQNQGASVSFTPDLSLVVGRVGEQEKYSLKDLGLACFRDLRNLHPLRDESSMAVIVKDPRIAEFKRVRVVLNKGGVDIKAIEKVNEDLGFLGNNLVHGVVDPIERTLVAGVCFPEQPTLQSILPLLAVKDLLEANKANVAYVALPVFAYAGAGLPRRSQYLETLGLMRKLYGDSLGERVFIVPDTREEVMRIKYKMCNLASRFVSDEPAKVKYKFSNLFRFFETASYGADVVIGALAERGDASIVCDFRQFESVHAGSKMAKSFGKRIGALLYTVLSPTFVNGDLREVSQDAGAIDTSDNLPGEISALLYQASILFPPEKVADIYNTLRKGERLSGLEEEVKIAKAELLAVHPASESDVRSLEDISMERLAVVNDILTQATQKRINVPDRYIQHGVIYENK